MALENRVRGATRSTTSQTIEASSKVDTSDAMGVDTGINITNSFLFATITPTHTPVVAFATETHLSMTNLGNRDAADIFSVLKILSIPIPTAIISIILTVAADLSPDPSTNVVSSVTPAATSTSATPLQVFGDESNTSDSGGTTTLPMSTSSAPTRALGSGSQTTSSPAPISTTSTSHLISISPSIAKATGAVVQKMLPTSSFTTAASPPLLSPEGAVGSSVLTNTMIPMSFSILKTSILTTVSIPTIPSASAPNVTSVGTQTSAVSSTTSGGSPSITSNPKQDNLSTQRKTRLRSLSVVAGVISICVVFVVGLVLWRRRQRRKRSATTDLGGRGQWMQRSIGVQDQESHLHDSTNVYTEGRSRFSFNS